MNVFVGVPVYNAMPFLVDSIASLQDQTHKDFTCLLIDDGSSDGSGEFLDSIDDPRFQVTHQPNRGIVATLNRMIEMCPDDAWLVRHDADDLSDRERLGSLIPHMREGVSLVHSAAAYLTASGGGLRFRASNCDAFEARMIVLSGRLLSVCHPSAGFSIGAAKAVGGYRNIRHAEDVDLWWRLALQGDVEFVDEVLVQYRMNPDGVSSQGFAEQSVQAIYSQYLLLSELLCRSPLPFEDVQHHLLGLVDHRLARFRARVRSSQAEWVAGSRRRALSAGVGALTLFPDRALSRIADEVRLRFSRPARDPISAGLNPALFLEISDVLWPRVAVPRGRE